MRRVERVSVYKSTIYGSALERAMWLYRLQQRLSITTAEGNVLLVVAFLLLLGVGVMHFQSTPPVLPEGIYDEVDKAFDEANPSADPVGLPGEQVDEASTERSQQLLSVAINSATVIELQQLPGIGPALAERIVAYREQHGGFEQPEDLTSVRGIGPRTLENVEPYIVLDDG